MLDIGATGSMFVTGLLMTNPIGLTFLVGVGIGYGIYRIGWGDNADAFINNKIGFNNKK